MPWIGINEASSRRKIGPRLQHALVADLVVNDLANPVADEVLRRHQDDEREWTENLARQLDIRWNWDVHETLLMIVLELDTVMGRWPDVGEDFVRELVHEATKNMTSTEALSMLIAGPSQWRSARIKGDCKVENLGGQLRPLLEKSLTAALVTLLTKWEAWDIRALRDRSRTPTQAAAKARANAAPTGGARRRPPRDPKRVEGHYTPPPRT